MNGKSKCKILKEIRKQIALNNDIEFVVSECKYKGDCLGTCPKCEQELKYLEAELLKRSREGKKIAVAGIAAALIATSTGCSYTDYFFENFPENTESSESDYYIQITGEVMSPDYNNNSNYWVDDTEVSSQIQTHPDISELISMSEAEALNSICHYRRDLRIVWENYLVKKGMSFDTYEFAKDGEKYIVEIKCNSKSEIIGVSVISQTQKTPDISELINMSEAEALNRICRFREELRIEWKEHLTIKGLNTDTYEFEKDGVEYRVEVEYDSKTKMIGVTVTKLPPESKSDLANESRYMGAPPKR